MEEHRDAWIGAPLLQGEVERAGPAQPGEEEAQGDLTNILPISDLKGRCKVDRVRFFPVALSARRRGSGHKLKHKRFSLSTRSPSVLCE